MKRSALQNELVVVLRMAFWARKVFETFEKRAPELICVKMKQGFFPDKWAISKLWIIF